MTVQLRGVCPRPLGERQVMRTEAMAACDVVLDRSRVAKYLVRARNPLQDRNTPETCRGDR